MRGKTLITAAVAVLTAAAVLVLPSAAGAQVCTYPEPTLAPTEGPTGTVVTISAAADTLACLPRPDAAKGTNVFVTIGESAQTPDASALANAQLQADGSWSTTWTVPGARPVGDVTLYATVWLDPGIGVANAAVPIGSGNETAVLDYQPLTFTVTAPPPSSTSSSTTSTTAAPAPGISVSDADLLPGESFTVFGSGFQPGATVEVWLESTPVLLGTAVADAVGDVQATVAVPAGFDAGAHTVRLLGTGLGGELLNLSTGVTVGSLVAAAAPAPTEATPAPAGELPRTGGVPVGTLVVATGLVLAGTLVLRLRTRASARA